MRHSFNVEEVESRLNVGHEGGSRDVVAGIVGGQRCVVGSPEGFAGPFCLLRKSRARQVRVETIAEVPFDIGHAHRCFRVTPNAPGSVLDTDK